MLLEVPPKRFTFERETLVTTAARTGKPKELKLKGQYNNSTTAATLQNAIKDKLAVSPSGRTLSDMLCLSCPDLSEYYYIVTSVRPWGGRKEGRW